MEDQNVAESWITVFPKPLSLVWELEAMDTLLICAKQLLDGCYDNPEQLLNHFVGSMNPIVILHTAQNRVEQAIVDAENELENELEVETL